MFDTMGIRFFICNLVIAALIGAVALIQKCFGRLISGRTGYAMWKFTAAAAAVPFIPPLAALSRRLSPAGMLEEISAFVLRLLRDTEAAAEQAAADIMPGTDGGLAVYGLDDYAVTSGPGELYTLNIVLLCIWGLGAAAGIAFLVRSFIRLRALKRAAVPVRDAKFCREMARCMDELKIRRDIQVYAAACLTTPVLAGIIRPRIYFPARLIKDKSLSGVRYILLHELLHYRRKDNLFNLAMSMLCAVYWFNPAMRLAGRLMEQERERACDESVMSVLGEDEYVLYGHTLLDVASANAASPAPFAAGMGSGMKVMKKRIENIAGYHAPTAGQRAKRMLVLILTGVVLLTGLPLFPALASDGQDAASVKERINGESTVSYVDLSRELESYDGSFVLYDETQDEWSIYNEESAFTRESPSSTWKIYDALLALESGVISPEDSELEWDGEEYPFEEWETDQDLASAIKHSVNWYFQDMDKAMGREKIASYLQGIGYGNEKIGPDTGTYWLDSSLKISPAEQVMLLKDMYDNKHGFAPENIDAVKEAMRISSGAGATLYGKTGTGKKTDDDVSGWFVGVLEKEGARWYFAMNIHGGEDATGSRAAELTDDILGKLHLL